ncbi:hypothetical protein PV326_007313 [Microctonus aethiopoides]|nr:hypothetical protein PV326_007313 [Microctonus aethiopoides]
MTDTLGEYASQTQPTSRVRDWVRVKESFTNLLVSFRILPVYDAVMRHESLYLLRDRGNRSSVPTVGATGAGRNTPSGTQGRAAVRNLGEGGSTCLDSPARKSDLHKAVGLYPCHRQGGNQITFNPFTTSTPFVFFRSHIL